jgi:hypothetical protein
LPFVGYPNPNTSHFKSEEIWETAKLPNENKKKTGWLGDLVENGLLKISGNNQPIINLHDDQTLFDKGINTDAFIWNDLNALIWYKNELEELVQKEKPNEIDIKIIEQFNKLNWMSKVKIEKGFSNSNFGQQIAKAATIINNELPFKVIHTKLSGFDTHLGETRRLPLLYQDLAYNLTKLKNNLIQSNLWENTSIFIYSEFGRTIDENKNEGTDHGHAGLSILINHKKLNFNQPEIIETNQIYLTSQLDFREIYKEIIN